MHVTIVGAGLGGLATAALLNPHVDVTVYERAAAIGGRARSQTEHGAILNLGPRALYAASAAEPVLARLGIRMAGATPPHGGKMAKDGALHAMPGGVAALLGSPLFSISEKLMLPMWLMARTVPDVPLAEWLAPAPPNIAAFILAMVRVSCYANAPALQSAQAAMRQVRLALRGVRYLDGGWQALVDALARGVEVETRDVQTLPEGDVVVLAGPPSLARQLGVPVPKLTPVYAACLDLVLDGLPRPENRFVLGMDQPHYLSEHGGVAELGGTVLHVARYLAPGEVGKEALPGLEALCDLAQPGWRERVKFRRFLPELVVTHRVDRPGEKVVAEHQIDGRTVHLVGDWVGEEAMLADRALASAATAADRILARMQAAA